MKVHSAIILGIALPLLGIPGEALADQKVAAPPVPAHDAASAQVISIRVEPSKLTLSDPRFPGRILVVGTMQDGNQTDLTREADFTPLNEFVRVEKGGLIYPVKDGEGKVEVMAAGRRVQFPVTVTGSAPPHPVNFVRDVLPVMNKVGCTSGPCHGGAKGKNGFKLSLRGYDPELDYQALIHDVSGRRFNRADPPRSLILLKPTQEVPHGGGFRFESNSRYYNTMLQWISEGAQFGDIQAARINKLEVLPSEIVLKRSGMSQHILVVAHYADGSIRDVTTEAVFTSSTPVIAEVSQEGLVTTSRKGEAAILIRYEGIFSTVNVTVLDERPGFQWVQLPQYNYIDRDVDEKLKKVKVLPSRLSTDSEFIRRVYLDLLGLPPAPEEVRAFLRDPAPSRFKRSRLIDRLLARPEYVDFWSLRWADLLQNNRKFVGTKGIWALNHWIRQSVAENKPYDQFVRELLTASGNTFQNPAANFFRVCHEPNVAMETMTQLFLGVRMMCAKCHDHPFERWTQNQYYQLTAFFAGLGLERGLDDEEEIVYIKRASAEVVHPKTGNPVAPKVPFGQVTGVPEHGDRREALARWLTSQDNPYFAMAIANRIWSYFFGRGIIDPVDDIRSSNPPTNGPLLEALSNDLKDHHFDLKYLIRTIVNSRTYQLSYRRNKWNEEDLINFSHAVPRRLTAEQLMDAISVATGSKLRFEGVPQDTRAAQVPDPHVGMGGFLDVFGRPPRQSPTEGDRRSDISLVQTLNLLNGATINEAIEYANGRIARLILSGASDRNLIEELYLAALCRSPDAAEVDRALQYFSAGKSRAERAQDVLWALLNTPEFLFNH